MASKISSIPIRFVYMMLQSQELISGGGLESRHFILLRPNDSLDFHFYISVIYLLFSGPSVHPHIRFPFVSRYQPPTLGQLKVIGFVWVKNLFFYSVCLVMIEYLLRHSSREIFYENLFFLTSPTKDDFFL